MEKLNILGTGHAMTLDCYNTCFTLENNEGEHILVDTGGGLQIIKQLRDANIDFRKIHHIILSHKHTDHILGMFWIMRYSQKLFSSNNYEGNLNVYMHKELESTIRKIMFEVLPAKFTDLIDNRIIFHIVEDKEERKILNYSIKFLDVQAKKVRQFGFKTTLENGKTFVFLGDETFSEELRDEVKDADWFLHEAMCLDSEAEEYKPYEKMHSTVKTASEIAESLNVKNLLLYHSNDNDLKNRKRLYTEEAKKYFSGNIYVPDDLEIIRL
ncbi:MAG TPA: MBL fold metallo-hydrolase [Candidatus Merdicola faecigallinarum]|uniref:MBL fold metallo-hydrolase n=1 Tax=Candidatus Merdicola faecigallinarum TaxID=2840862 RepID=A0A9D1M172_9FIRM|nr:MBL fold metallo-hydrolase [Candidatus Merdicola faecigallinarum]